MIFDKEFDEILNIIVNGRGKNSIEIAIFISNLPKEFFLKIRDALTNNEKSDIAISYSTSDNWYYNCKIKRNNINKELTLSQRIVNDNNTVFSFTITSFNDSLRRQINNYETKDICTSRYRYNDKNYLVTYKLKKFPSEYLIIVENFHLGTRASNKFSYIINNSNISNNLELSEFDNIIKDRIKKRKKSKN